MVARPTIKIANMLSSVDVEEFKEQLGLDSASSKSTPSTLPCEKLGSGFSFKYQFLNYANKEQLEMERDGNYIHNTIIPIKNNQQFLVCRETCQHLLVYSSTCIC